MNLQIKLHSLLFAIVILSGCQTVNTSNSSTETDLHYTAMASTVAELRQVPCHVPATPAEQARLAQFDPMVIVGGALHAWVPPHQFPAYLQAMQDTLDCDSEQWVWKFQETLAHSPTFAHSLAVLNTR